MKFPYFGLRATLRYFCLIMAGLALVVECLLIPSEASAVARVFHSGPLESPGGSYILQGQLVGLCLSHASNGRSWVEWNTTLPGGLGNCPAGWTQLVVWADPQGVEPTSSPSP